MDDPKEGERNELLLAMYKSVGRMNEHLLMGNLESALSEQALQINLRSNFERLGEPSSEGNAE